jgi:peptidoglycan/LPS O-acetylase OafA/YrhL
LCVLVFFLLSGYVIGLAHKEPLTLKSTPIYLKKRFLRIYPIYFLCLLFALITARTSYSLTTIISHLTLTQGLFAPVIKEISPAWSLVYEFIFYLLFIPLSYFRINTLIITALCILLGCLNAYFYPTFNHPLFSSYVFGFAFWLCGLSIAKYFSSNSIATGGDYALMASVLFLLMAIGVLDAPVTLFNQISTHLFGKDLSILPQDQPGTVSFRDFGYLPYCFLITVVFAKSRIKNLKLVAGLLIIMPLAT